MKFNENQINIPAKYPLSGTLTIPQDDIAQHPTVLIIGGSGKGNRDGNLKKLNTNIYKKLACALSVKGMATLRYDKRGISQSEGDYYQTGISDLIEDGLSALRFLKSSNQVDASRIYILGHSEGAMIAPAVYSNEVARGLILLCGTSLPGKELLYKQPLALAQEIRQVEGFKRILFKLFKADKKVITQFEAILHKALSTNNPFFHYLFIKINAKWLREIYHYDVREYLRKISCPALIIGAGNDIQVDPEDTKKIAAYIPGTTRTVVVENMNHLLRTHSEKHHLLTLMKEYRYSVENDLDANLINEICDWLNDN